MKRRTEPVFTLNTMWTHNAIADTSYGSHLIPAIKANLVPALRASVELSQSIPHCSQSSGRGITSTGMLKYIRGWQIMK